MVKHSDSPEEEDLLCNTYTGGNPNGTTFDGIAPFTTAGDLSTPNPAFQRVDDMINFLHMAIPKRLAKQSGYGWRHSVWLYENPFRHARLVRSGA
jgi:hypothetical protein